MSDVVGFVQIINPNQCEWVPSTAKNAGELRTGHLAKLDSSGRAIICTTGDTSDGVVFNNRYQTYAPTSVYADAGEELSLAQHNVRMLCDSTNFDGNTLPSFGADLYVGPSGLLTTAVSGTVHVGKVVRSAYEGANMDVRTPPGGATNLNNLVEVALHIAYN